MGQETLLETAADGCIRKEGFSSGRESALGEAGVSEGRLESCPAKAES